MDVATRVASLESSLTKSERRVADVVLRQPELVAFRTVAAVAEAAGAGAATVVRFATRLGFDGFGQLQAAVQRDLSQRLRPAAERIRQQAHPDLLEQHLRTAVENVTATLQQVDAASLDRLVERLSDHRAKVAVLTGDASAGVARQFAGDLDALRGRVQLLDGSAVATGRSLSEYGPDDALVAIDLRRYDRDVVDAVTLAARRGVWVSAFTDGPLSPLARHSDASFVLHAEAVGPFDSHVGTLALADLVVAAVAARLRGSAVERLDRAESAWREGSLLVDD
ncbi:MAG: hypothetical protein RI900_2673 [Actinomycetota bacterium]